MLHKIFSVYDVKAQAFMTPFMMPTEGMATRAIKDCVNDVNHQFSKHPSDYTLFTLGSFNDEEGFYDLYETPQSLGLIVQFIGKDPHPEQLTDDQLFETMKGK